ncbi:hypothetical protein [Salinicola aestuarinus]|uniref:hypothetical protein n=1 Tax=Salinicola aestuarinus TaxID=1949082 RepID=UPI00130035B5|nr:hypothetical protein [Salinicola aestuarinus]
MILINSAGYVVPELQVEYGKVPACMLPLGNRLLLQHQLQIVEESALSDQRIILSLPASYSISSPDRAFFDSKNILVVRVPDEFTLGESVLYVLNSSGTVDEELYMLHGDTYLQHFPDDLDVVGVSQTTENYNWQLEEISEDSELMAVEDDGENDVSYSLEYLTLPPLNEVYVYGLNPSFYWKKIFSLVGTILTDFRSQMPDSEVLHNSVKSDFEVLIRDKTFKRLSQFAQSGIYTLDTPVRYNNEPLGTLKEIASRCIDKTLLLPRLPAWIHGDMCFSNMLFDSRADNLKLIDPRGINDRGELTVYGDQCYDLAKLFHSVVGMYDYIIAGRYRLEMLDAFNMNIEFDVSDRLRTIQKLFLDAEFIPGLSTRDVQPLVVLLFLSMLPLHSDRPDRQEAMLANALRLYAEIKETHS